MVEAKADNMKKAAAEQGGCSTCRLGCPTARSMQQFPRNIQERMDALVARMGAFGELCRRQGASCNGGKPPALTREIVGEFAGIVREYQEFLNGQGQIYPSLRDSLDNMLELHANDVFEYLASKTRA